MNCMFNLAVYMKTLQGVPKETIIHAEKEKTDVFFQKPYKYIPPKYVN